MYSENQISVATRAYVDGDRPIGGGVTDGIRARSISLAADDVSTISAFAGAASLAGSIGGVAGVSLSIGLSLAKNTIGGEVAAYVANADDGVRTTAGPLKLRARETSSIDAVAAAASLAGGFGLAAGVSLSGAGAESTNIILTDANAYAAHSQLAAAGPVELDASNASAIDAFVLTASFSASVGGMAGVGASIGAAVAQNLIGWNPGGASTAEVQAYLLDTSLVATGDVTLTALSQEDIESTVYSGAGAVSGGGVGLGLSGSGVTAVNKIGTRTRAAIDGDRTTGISAANMTLSAKDQSTVKSDAGAVSLAAAFGGTVGGALSIGVALARNELANVVESYVVNADQGVTVSSLTISADETGSITSRTVAASLAVGAAGFAGIGLSGAGAAAVNAIGTDVRSYVQDSRIVSGGKVDLDATNKSSIDAKVVALSAAAAVGSTVGVGVAIGAAVAKNEIGSVQGATRNGAEVQAYLRNTSVRASGDLTLDAVSEMSITSLVGAGAVAIAGAGGVGIAASGSGVDSTNASRADVRAFIDGAGATGISARAVLLTARDVSQITADAGSAAIAASLAGTVAISLAIGVTLAENTIQNIVEASIANADNLVATTGDVALVADEKSGLKSLASAASAAAALAAPPSIFGVALSVGAVTAENLVDGKVAARVSGSDAVTARQRITLAATDTSTIDSTVRSETLAVGFVGIAIGLSSAESTLKNQVSATSDGSNLTSQLGSVSITAAVAPTSSTRSTVSALAAGLISGAGAGANADTLVEGTAAARLEGGRVSANLGDVILRATSTSRASPTIDGSTLGLVAISDLTVDALMKGVTEATVAPNTTLYAPNGKVAVEALSNSVADARTKSNGVGILLDVSVSKPNALSVAQTTASMLGRIEGANGAPGAARVSILADSVDYAAAASFARQTR